MRTTIRTATLATLLALALPAAAPASSANDRIYGDCEHSATGYLTGSYTKAQLRDALRHIPGDVAEYSGCYDAIRQALLAGGRGGTGAGGTGAGGTGGGGIGATGGSGIGGAGTPGSAAGGAGGIGATGQPHAAGSKAPVKLAGEAVEPGVVPSFAKDPSTLPTPLLVFLILLGAGVLALTTTTLGRRVLARRRG
jgi:hypothetical protein